MHVILRRLIIISRYELQIILKIIFMKILSSFLLTFAQVAILSTAANLTCQVALIVGIAATVFAGFLALGEK